VILIGSFWELGQCASSAIPASFPMRWTCDVKPHLALSGTLGFIRAECSQRDRNPHYGLRIDFGAHGVFRSDTYGRSGGIENSRPIAQIGEVVAGGSPMNLPANTR
jgi:hypothetical protein